MTFLSRSTALLALTSLGWFVPTPANAQDLPKIEPKADAPSTLNVVPANRQSYIDPRHREIKDEIKPLAPVAIPDNPPPHEGAFFDLPLTVEPPDILVVELLEGLPGRPITGERMIRPDGTISFGFYGDVHVRGLTLRQAKERIIIHLRHYLIDEVLGLVKYAEESDGEMPDEVTVPPIPNPGRSPFDLEPPPKPPEVKPVPDPAAEAKQDDPAKIIKKKETQQPVKRANRGAKKARRVTRTGAIQEPAKVQRPDAVEGPKPKPPVEVPMVDEPAKGPGRIIPIEPVDSQRVFVDITSYNSHVYYVQGDVGVPGRLPFTGRETVLDALNYAGGLIPSSEPLDIHLYRPARGGKPAKDYKINFEAIRKGDAMANLQVFPNDRIVVGRNPIVQKNVEIDRATGLINSLMNSIYQYTLSARWMTVMNSPLYGPPGGVTQTKGNDQAASLPVGEPWVMAPAQRDALLKQWVELIWTLSSKEGGALLDEDAFRAALMKKLTPESK